MTVRFLVLCLLCICCFSACETAKIVSEALVESTRDMKQEMDYEYGSSPYYQQSSTKRAVDKSAEAADVFAGIVFRAEHFKATFKEKMSLKYGAQIVKSRVTPEALADFIYESLVQDNVDFKQALRKNFSDTLEEEIKRELEYYEYRESVDKLSEDMKSILQEIKAGTRTGK